jgi:UDP-N-acetylglucosamine transferase subunit ALG13
MYEPSKNKEHHRKTSLSDLQKCICSVERIASSIWRKGSLCGMGIMILIVVSTGHFDPLIQKCNELKSKYDFVGQIGMGSFLPDFEYFRQATPLEIESEMKEAELVITHAGTGMLSMLCRLKKKAVVIPKQIRYGEANDGQVELAKKWHELKCATLCMDIQNLETAITQCRNSNPVFPSFPSLGKALRGKLDLSSDTFVSSV